MSQYFLIHPQNPQKRLLTQAVSIINDGGVIVYPTDSGYALGCHIGDKQAMQRLINIRQLNKQHNFTLVCRDLSEIAVYAKVSNSVYRLLKAHTPGSYTFILPATREVPRRLQHTKRKTIGIRVPDHNITLALLDVMNEPLMSTTLLLPDETVPMSDPQDIRAQLEHQVDLIIDGEQACLAESTTVVDLTTDCPTVIRQGRGVIDWLG